MRLNYFGLLPILVLTLPATSHAEIFKCVAENGELTFSQTPCHDGKVTVQGTLEHLDDKRVDCEYARHAAPATAQKLKPGASSSLKKSRYSKQAANRTARADKKRLREACRDKLRSQIDRINSQLRSGYSASRGISLRSKRRDLERRMREC